MEATTDFKSGRCYYLANVGNTGELIFDGSPNYNYFQAMLKRKTKRVAEVIAWTLISNQYHLVVKVHSGFKLRKMARGKNTAALKRISGKEYSKMITRCFAGLLSGYARAYNKMNNRKGSLFRENFIKIELSGREEIELFTRAVLEMQSFVKSGDRYNLEHTISSGIQARLLTKDIEKEEVRSWAGQIDETGIKTLVKPTRVYDPETEAQKILGMVEEELAGKAGELDKLFEVAGLESGGKLRKHWSKYRKQMNEEVRGMKVRILAEKLFLH